jgi:cytidylate kinase
LDYLFFDTGVMYRAVTWAALERQIDIDHVEEISKLAETLTIEVKPGHLEGVPQSMVLIDGQDITPYLRSPAVEAHVSRVSSYPRVRAALTIQQRRIATAGSVVMVGRDIGTVVLPDADLKIFMQASPEERAHRRYHEAVTQNRPANFDEILAAIQQRDQQDRDKPISPMIPAADAIVINTDKLTIAEVLAKLKHLVDCVEP